MLWMMTENSSTIRGFIVLMGTFCFLSARACVFKKKMHNLTMFHKVEVWAIGRPFHSLYCHMQVSDDPGSIRASIFILEDGFRCQIVEI